MMDGRASPAGLKSFARKLEKTAGTLYQITGEVLI